jgi:hypothetical protein
MAFKLGKLPARHDARIPLLADRADFSKFPPLPFRVAWHAKLPVTGVPLLGNDKYGCCVEASVCHFIQQMGLYTNKEATPTETECLQIYADVTGFNAADPNTDQGTVFAGRGGMLEHWANAGVVVGGRLNRTAGAARLTLTDPLELQNAINVFGFVFVGASLTQADVDSPFLWDQKRGPLIGGHEFLLTGFEKTTHAVRYDVETWNGMWRASDSWIAQSVDEAYIVFDEAFFSATGKSPSGINRAALLADMKAFH